MTDAAKALRELETRADEGLAETPLARLPRVDVLKALYLLLDIVYLGNPAEEDERPRPDWVAIAINNLSYLGAFLLRCPDIASQLPPVDMLEQHYADLLFLFRYARLSELLPEVHRGYYVPEMTTDGFILRNPPDKTLLAHEQRDIIAAELAVPFSYERGPDLHAARLATPGATGGDPPVALEMRLAAELMDLHRKIGELPLISGAGFVAAVGCTRQEFIAFRAAWFAWGDLMRAASQHGREVVRAQDTARSQGQAFSESVERRAVDLWSSSVAVSMSPQRMRDLVRQTAGLTTDVFDRLVSLFELAPVPGPGHAPSADGVFPPFARLDDGVVFSPHVVRQMLSERNLIVLLSLRDARHFDSVVSSFLEPELIHQAVAILKNAGLRLVTEKKWKTSDSAGEFDIAALDEAGTLLHVQAKAAIPPHGARMTARLESRVEEALRQLRRFDSLTDGAQREVVAHAVGLAPTAWNGRSMQLVLCRSSLGTPALYEKLDGALAVPLYSLDGALERQVARGPVDLLALPDALNAYESELRSRVRPHWGTADLDLGTWAERDVTVNVPRLELDEEEINSERVRRFQHITSLLDG